MLGLLEENIEQSQLKVFKVSSSVEVVKNKIRNLIEYFKMKHMLVKNLHLN